MREVELFQVRQVRQRREITDGHSNAVRTSEGEYPQIRQFSSMFAQAPTSSLMAVYGNDPIIVEEGDNTITEFKLRYSSEEDLEMLRQKAKRFEASNIFLTINGEQKGDKSCRLSYTNPGGIMYLYKMFRVFEIGNVVQNDKEMTLDEFLEQNK